MRAPLNLIKFLLVAYLSACTVNTAGDLRSPQPELRSDLLFEIDRRVGIAGVRDAAFVRIPGYPYLRTCRFTAALAVRMHGAEQERFWLKMLRDLDREAREREIARLPLRHIRALMRKFGFPRPEDIRLVAEQEAMKGVERISGLDLERLKSRVRARDEYEGWRTVLG